MSHNLAAQFPVSARFLVKRKQDAGRPSSDKKSIRRIFGSIHVGDTARHAASAVVRGTKAANWRSIVLTASLRHASAMDPTLDREGFRLRRSPARRRCGLLRTRARPSVSQDCGSSPCQWGRGWRRQPTELPSRVVLRETGSQAGWESNGPDRDRWAWRPVVCGRPAK